MKKKILFFLINMNLGGTEKSFLNLVNALPPETEIDLLLLENKGQLLQQLPKNVNLHIIENSEAVNFLIQNNLLSYALYSLRRGEVLQTFRAIYYYIKSKFSGTSDYKFEAIQNKLSSPQTIYDIAVAYAGPHQFISSYIARNVCAAKKIQWIHFDIEKVITNFNFGKNLYHYFDRIFCVSESSKKIFLKHYPELKNKTDVFVNIVSQYELENKSLMGDSFADNFDGIRILTVGRITYEKGQHLIPMVIKKLKEDNFKFRWYLVGTGNQRDIIQQMAADLGITSELTFLGEKDNPYRYMRECDIYVQPSLHEGYCITVAEAQVFNKPIVVTNFASAKDLIKNNETGLIAEISSEGIYAALKLLLSNIDLREKFSANFENESKSIEEELQKFML